MCTYLKSLKITQSFSSAHNPYDNSVMESFFSAMKCEELYRTKYRSEQELRNGIDSISLASFDINSIFGDITNKHPNPEDYLTNINNGIGDISDNTGDIADSVAISEEDLKYLRDIAEQETVNRFTTAEITVEQHNTNNISSKMDIDGVIDELTDATAEAVYIIAEGVHV